MNTNTTGPLVRIRITRTIEGEYETRLPEHLPLDKLNTGWCELTLEEARAVLSDAEHNSDRNAVDVGPYGVPLPVFNAYRALARQARTAIAAAVKRQGVEVASAPSPGEDDITEPYRKVFEAQARDSYGFKRSRKGIYINPQVARDWKWFQAGLRACIATRSNT